jgi:hypothetical protein
VLSKFCRTCKANLAKIQRSTSKTPASALALS